jgi:hypothetical protein
MRDSASAAAKLVRLDLPSKVCTTVPPERRTLSQLADSVYRQQTARGPVRRTVSMTMLTPWALFATGALAPCRSHAFGTASPDFDARRKWFAELSREGARAWTGR